MADTEYWIELSTDLAGLPETAQTLDDCGLTLIRYGPVHAPWGSPRRTRYWLVSDPAAPEELWDMTVDLTFERTVAPNPSPEEFDAMPEEELLAWAPTYTTKITERKAR